MALKGIEKVESKFCVQTAVYWGNPTNDGYGGFTFDSPVEIMCRWDDVSKVDVGPDGNIQLTRSSIMVTQDLDELGYLYLGSLDDFDSTVDTSKPQDIQGAYIIHRFDKTPMVFKTDEFVRVAHLYI
jgi:hypothetical protein